MSGEYGPMSGNNENFDGNDDLWLDDAQIDALFALADSPTAATDEFGELGAVLSTLKVALLDVPEIAPSPELAEFINVADGELLSDLPPLDAVDVEVELADFDVDEMLRVLTTPDELASARSAVRHGRGAWWGSLAAAAVAAVLLIATIGIPNVSGGSGFQGNRDANTSVAEQPAIAEAILAPDQSGNPTDGSLVGETSPADTAPVDPAPVDPALVDPSLAEDAQAEAIKPAPQGEAVEITGDGSQPVESEVKEPAPIPAANQQVQPVAPSTSASTSDPVSESAPVAAVPVAESAPVAGVPAAESAPATAELSVVEPAPAVVQPAVVVTDPAPAPIAVEPAPRPAVVEARPSTAAPEPAPLPAPVAEIPVTETPVTETPVVETPAVPAGPSSSAPSAPISEPAEVGTLEAPEGPGGVEDRPVEANGAD